MIPHSLECTVINFLLGLELELIEQLGAVRVGEIDFFNLISQLVIVLNIDSI